MVLFLQSIKSFCSIPENESEQPVLGCNTSLVDSDIVNLAKGFSDRTVAAGKISFGLRRTNLLKANIRWDQEVRRISRKPSLIGISNAVEFRADIEAERKRDSIRKHSLEESASLR